MTTAKKKKNSNPLYVVSKKGKVVEPVKNRMDLIVKKLGFAPMLEVMNSIWAILLSNIKNYPSLVAIENLLNKIVIEIRNNVEYLNRLLLPFLSKLKFA